MLGMRRHLLAAVAAIFAVGFTAAHAAEPFTLRSTTFADGAMMPKNTGNSHANAPNNPNCNGDNVTPQLSWSNVPDGTKSFVFLVTDPLGRGGAGFIHWVAYGIPASITSFAEGELGKPSDKYVGGKSGFGVGFFSGPCPPPNGVPHHLNFILAATDFETTDLPPGLTYDEVTAKLAAPGQPPAHTKSVTSLIGLYVAPWHQ